MSTPTIMELMGVEPKYDFSGQNTYPGSTVPRVTSILSFIDNEGLIDWANYMGRKGLDNKKILESAANTGTIAHESIENYLRNGIEPRNPAKAFMSFRKWYNERKLNYKMEVLGQEERLCCEWFTGTYDLLLKMNDKVFLVDFKTSNHVHYKYCLQLAAYRYMLKLNKGIDIDGCIILQLNKTSVKYTEYGLDFSNPDDLNYINMCEKAFLELAMLYHQIHFVKELYPW